MSWFEFVLLSLYLNIRGHNPSHHYVLYDVPGLAVAEVIDSDKVYYYTSNPNDDSSNLCPLVPFAVMC